MLTDELLAYIFDGQTHLLKQPISAWLISSRRFTDFVNAFKDKIRKKIRTTQDQENLLDLQLELETAYLLLKEKTLSLVYEEQLAEKLRSPDFSVTYTTSLTFMLEVTRIRAATKEQTQVITDAVCSKIGQLLPRYSNVLVIGMPTLNLTQDDFHKMMMRLQQRTENNDVALLQRYRFRDRASFFQQYYRLSEILLRGSDSIITWINPQAKDPLPSKVRTVLYRSQKM